MSTDPTNQHLESITTALLSRDPSLPALYVHDAQFRMQLDWLVGLLPTLVDALETGANAAAAARRQAIDQAHLTTPRLLLEGDTWSPE